MRTDTWVYRCSCVDQRRCRAAKWGSVRCPSSRRRTTSKRAWKPTSSRSAWACARPRGCPTRRPCDDAPHAHSDRGAGRGRAAGDRPTGRYSARGSRARGRSQERPRPGGQQLRAALTASANSSATTTAVVERTPMRECDRDHVASVAASAFHSDNHDDAGDCDDIVDDDK